MFMDIYIYIYIYIYMFKCLNEKENVVFLTSIMLRKYGMIMISIVL